MTVDSPPRPRHRPPAGTCLQRDEPWPAGRLRLTAALVGLALAGLGICWAGAAAQDQDSDQIGWLAGAIGATAAAALVLLMWLSSGITAVHAERRSILAASPDLGGDPGGPAEDPVVAAPGMTRFHRPDCRFVADRPGLAPVTGPARALLRPCGVCQGEPK